MFELIIIYFVPLDIDRLYTIRKPRTRKPRVPLKNKHFCEQFLSRLIMNYNKFYYFFLLLIFITSFKLSINKIDFFFK